jgi:UTP:GlnB (protein PII) uridylyltransferase
MTLLNGPFSRLTFETIRTLKPEAMSSLLAAYEKIESDNCLMETGGYSRDNFLTSSDHLTMLLILEQCQSIARDS